MRKKLHAELDWKNQFCAQSYDGAAVMQGQYSGLRTLIQEHNTRAVPILMVLCSCSEFNNC